MDNKFIWLFLIFSLVTSINYTEKLSDRRKLECAAFFWKWCKEKTATDSNGILTLLFYHYSLNK